MRNLSKIMAVTAGALLCGSLAQAQATRTWVSGVGDDANPCSRTAPCKTFQGSIAKTAAGGEINVLDPGGFGAVTITKSITISSEHFEAGVLVAGTNGIIVNVGAADTVVLRGLDIEGLSTGLSGVLFLGGGRLFVEKCTINGFRSASAGFGISFTPNTAGAQIHVTDTIVRNNGTSNIGGGILIQPNTGITGITGDLTRVVMEGNVFGLKVQDGTNISVRDSVAGGNAFAGLSAVAASSGPAKLSISNSSSTNNGTVGVQANGTGAETRISGVTTTGNGTGLLAVGGGSLISFKNNSNDGNTSNGVPSSSVTQQ